MTHCNQVICRVQVAEAPAAAAHGPHWSPCHRRRSVRPCLRQAGGRPPDLGPWLCQSTVMSPLLAFQLHHHISALCDCAAKCVLLSGCQSFTRAAAVHPLKMTQVAMQVRDGCRTRLYPVLSPACTPAELSQVPRTLADLIAGPDDEALEAHSTDSWANSAATALQRCGQACSPTQRALHKGCYPPHAQTQGCSQTNASVSERAWPVVATWQLVSAAWLLQAGRLMRLLSAVPAALSLDTRVQDGTPVKGASAGAAPSQPRTPHLSQSLYIGRQHKLVLA